MEPYPASPEPEHRPGRPGPAPSSVRNAVNLIWAGVGVGLVSTVLAFLDLDATVDDAMEAAGSTVDRDAAQVGVVVGIVVSALVSVGLAALFAYFIGRGANWARIVYTVLGILGLLFSLAGLGNLQPASLVLSLVGMVLTIASVVLLFRPDSNAFFKQPRP